MCPAVICSPDFRGFEPMLQHYSLKRHSRSGVIVDAVRQCIGTRFRAQGRLKGVGLDCIGVALIAGQAAGIVAPKLPAYRLGDSEADLLDNFMRSLGLQAQTSGAPGDLWVFAPGHQRRHLAIQATLAVPQVSPISFVHAHGGIGVVVEAPVAVEFLPMGIWRFPEGQ